MTTFTAPTLPEADAKVRPIPWRRMAWVTWRQHRMAIGGVTVFLGALAIYVWLAGRNLHHAHAAATACNPSSPACGDMVTHFNFLNHLLQGGYALQIVPPLIGAFIGAPILAREMETGTFRYAWTQGFPRWRWALAKIVAIAVAVTAAAGALSVLLSWYYQPYLATTNQARQLTEASPFSLALFDLRGVSFAAWTLAATTIGTFAGIIIRRVVPAIVAALAAYTGLALLAANVLRQHYLAPLLTTAVNVPGSAWIMNQYWTRVGRFAFATWRDAPQSLVQACSGGPPGPLHKPLLQSFTQCAAQHGYTQITRYEPASRFWAFQGVEGGWLLALSAALIALTVWLVHRHAT